MTCDAEFAVIISLFLNKNIVVLGGYLPGWALEYEIECLRLDPRHVQFSGEKMKMEI